MGRGDPAVKPYIRRTMIESYFGSAFHWIAYGTATKRGQHKENHSSLPSYLNGLGEPRVMLATKDLADWDETFVRNVLLNGILLWSRGDLCGPLAALFGGR